MKAIEVIKKVKKRKKDWVIELRQINTLCSTKAAITARLTAAFCLPPTCWNSRKKVSRSKFDFLK